MPGDDQQQIRKLPTTIQEAWLTGEVERLNACFAQDMVIAGADLRELARGRWSCVDSYRDFISQAKVRYFKFDEPDVTVHGLTSVVNCPWEIDYELSGESYHEHGRDLMICNRDQEGWMVVYRIVVFTPARS